MKRVHVVVYMSMFIALEVILTRFLSIQTPIVRIGFTFLPIALSAILFGPLLAGTAAALADILGMMIFPSGGAYFPGFTLTAFVAGMIYGLFLYRKTITWKRVTLCVIVNIIVTSMVLDTTWIWMMTGKAWLVLLPPRILKNLLLIPIEILLIQGLWRSTISRMNLQNILNKTQA